jgi:hypothetical protein
MHSAVSQAYNSKELLGELGFIQPKLPCFEDNSGAIDWIIKPKSNSRMKHVEVKYYWLRDTHELKECEYIKIDTTIQKADMFTKPLDYTSFMEQVKLLYNIDNQIRPTTSLETPPRCKPKYLF